MSTKAFKAAVSAVALILFVFIAIASAGPQQVSSKNDDDDDDNAVLRTAYGVAKIGEFIYKDAMERDQQSRNK